MTDKPWIRPLPAMTLLMFVGFWASFFVRDSGRGLLVNVFISVCAAAPAYYLAYALTLAIRRRRRKSAPNETALWRRLAHQAVIFAVITVAVGLSWILLISLALVFGAPPSVLANGMVVAWQIALQYVALSMALVLPLEVIYSLAAAGKRAA